MEAYMSFSRVAGDDMVAAAARRDEQEEDIGSPSESTSGGSAGSSASSELDDDASSSSSSSSSADRFEMCSLMTHLPIKRGLSRFFDGKSQSFASLAAVGTLDDLAKPPRKRLKPSRSFGGGLDEHRDRLLSPRRHCPKAAAAAKKVAARPALFGAAPRRPPLAVAVPARPEGVAGKAVIVS